MRIFAIIFCLFSLAFGIAKTPSTIPAAREIYIDLNPEACDQSCLNELITTQMLAEFMARFSATEADENLSKIYQDLGGKIATKAPKQDSNIIAVIMPNKVIKSYTQIITNALSSYVLESGAKVSLKFYLSGDERAESIQNSLQNARRSGAKIFITPFTNVGVSALSTLLQSDEIAYIPTIHAAMSSVKAENLIFGGAPYMEQISSLLSYARSKVSVFSDGSELGNYLDEQAKLVFGGEIYNQNIPNKEINLSEHIDISRTNNSAILLNLPIARAALVASQLKSSKINATALLSTQIGFNPYILKMIDHTERQNFYFASSIDISSRDMIATGALFGIDLRYSFAAYAACVGLEHIYTTYIRPEAKRYFNERVQDSQIGYDVKIYSTYNYDFRQRR